MGRLLREPRLRRYLVAQATSCLGDGMVPVALAFAVLGLGGTASQLGLVLTAQIGPAVLFILVGGVVGDRLPRRSLMVTADAVRTVSQGAMAVALLTGTATIGRLAALAAVTGTASAFFEPAAQATLPGLAGDELLARANAARATNMAVGTVAGPALAGLLVTLAQPGWAIAGDALSFAVSGVLLAGLPSVAATGGGTPLLQDLRAGWREFASRTWVWTSVVAAGAARLMFAAFFVLGPVMAAHRLGGAPAWSAIGSAFGAGLFVGGATAFRLRPRRPLLASSLGAALLALPLAFLALAAPVAAIAAAALVAGAGVMLAEALWTTTLQRHIPAAVLSRVVAYDLLGSLGLQPAGLALWGPVAAAAGVSNALWGAFVVQALATVALLGVRDVRRLRPGPELALA